MEYLVRWRGYGFEGDTWEPEGNLGSCVEFINEFNRQHSDRPRDGANQRSTRRSPSTGLGLPSNNARKQMNRSQPHNSSMNSALGRTSPSSPGVPSTSVTKQLTPPQTSLDRKDIGSKADTQQQQPPQPLLSNPTFRCPAGVSATESASTVSDAAAARAVRCSMDLAKSGIKILVPKSPMNNCADSEESPSEAAHSLDQGGQEPGTVPPEVALQDKSVGLVLGPGQERARMGTRPRTQTALPPPQVPITPAAVRTLNGKGTAKGFILEY